MSGQDLDDSSASGALTRSGSKKSTTVKPLRSLGPPPPFPFNGATETVVKKLADLRMTTILSEYASSVTLGYQLALRNRLIVSDVDKGGRLDCRLWPLVFLHDTMMLPGSLTKLLSSYYSQDDMIPLMVPGILPGFKALIHPITRQPALVPSSNHFVRGMLIMGRGKRQRERIAEHYESTRRCQAHVFSDGYTIEPSPARWLLVRMPFMAIVHVADDVQGLLKKPGIDSEEWRLETYLTGQYF